MSAVDIFLKARLGEAGGFGDAKFVADIARKIMVFGFPCLRLRIEKQNAFEFRQKFICRAGQQESHVFQVHAAFFIQRNNDGFLWRLNRL